MRVYLVDLESGNLRSVAQAVQRVASNAQLKVGRNPADLAQAERIILPGVGAFPALASRLFAEANLVATLEERKSAGVPILGICVGMQLLAEVGLEYGETAGLGWIAGRVAPLAKETSKATGAKKLRVPRLRVPRMGWSLVAPTRPSPLLPEPEWFYFAHSYHFVAKNSAQVLATTSHATAGDTTALIGEAPDKRVWGAQFHPEKSGRAGMAFLTRFLAPSALV